LGKKFYNSLKFGPNFLLQQLKNKIILNFVKFVATKKVQQIFSPLSFVAVFGSGIRDKHPGSAALIFCWHLESQIRIKTSLIRNTASQ
jgi:hypothetical protein